MIIDSQFGKNGVGGWIKNSLRDNPIDLIIMY